MTDLERKLAEALRGQAGEVTPNLDAAWADQMRRQRRPRRRRATVWVAPLAAVLVVLTSVLLVTRMQASSPPVPPANPGQPVTQAKLVHRPMTDLQVTGTPVALTDFAGQTDLWTAYAFTATAAGQVLFCVAAVPKELRVDRDVPQFGTESPLCTPPSSDTVRAGYAGELGGPLPPGTAVYLVDPGVKELRLYDANGGLSVAKPFGKLSSDQVFFARPDANSSIARWEVSSSPEAHPASR